MNEALLASLIVEQATTDMRNALMWLLKYGYDISDIDRLYDEVCGEYDRLMHLIPRTYEIDKKLSRLRYAKYQLNLVNDSAAFFRGKWFQNLVSIMPREVNGEEVIEVQKKIAIETFSEMQSGKRKGIPHKNCHDKFINESRGRKKKK